jgi:hypothetical protein
MSFLRSVLLRLVLMHFCAPLIFGNAPVCAQEANASPPEIIAPPITAEESEPGTATGSAEPPLPASSGATNVETPSANAISGTARRFQYAFHVALREISDDNVNLSATNRLPDYYTSLELGVKLGVGDTVERQANFLAIDYSPRFTFFAENSRFNSIQQISRLEGQYGFGRLTVGLSQEIQLLDGNDINLSTGIDSTVNRVNLDVSGRTRLNVYTTSLNANYSLTGKTFLTGNLSYTVSDYATLISSSIIAANAYINYTYSPKLAIGVGLAGGYNLVDSPSQSQIFEQVNALTNSSRRNPRSRNYKRVSPPRLI